MLNLTRWKWNSLPQFIYYFLNWDEKLGWEKMPRDALDQARHRVNPQNYSVLSSSSCAVIFIASGVSVTVFVHCCDESNGIKRGLFDCVAGNHKSYFIHISTQQAENSEKHTALSRSIPANLYQLTRSSPKCSTAFKVASPVGDHIFKIRNISNRNQPQ